jgi:hypothetical protein
MRLKIGTRLKIQKKLNAFLNLGEMLIVDLNSPNYIY